MNKTAHLQSDKPRRAVRMRAGTAALWALGAAIALLVLIGRAPQPARAQEPGEASGAAANAATLSMAVQSNGSGAFAAASNVNNNALLLYRIRIANTGSAPLSAIRFESVMPSAGLDSIQCALCTETRVTTSTIVNELGDSEIVTVTRELIWELPGTVAVGAFSDVTFSARVVAQVGGPAIENSTLAFFKQGGVDGSAVSNGVSLKVVADVPTTAVVTATTVSTTPTWYSSDLGGTLDLDWGDFDLDGDLDLAMASTVGASVYRNDDGQMALIWSDPQARATYSVRWLNVDATGAPELVAIGTPNGAVAGSNFVYQYNPGITASPDRFTVMANGQFDTAAQLTRLETADFDGDGLPDLLVSVNAISAACPVLLLRNEGANLFKGAPRCVSTAGSAAMAAADVDGDGDPDVALGLFPNQVRVFLNKPDGVKASGLLTITNPAANTVFVDAPNYFLAYDFAWGDIDRDGDLDLVAAFPLQREVRLYRNMRIPARGAADSGVVSFQQIQPPLSTGVFLTPYAVDLGDMDRDGYLDLIVADKQPTIYWNTKSFDAPFVTTNLTQLDLQDENAEVWSIRAVDQDGDGTLEISIANRSGPSLILANYSPALSNLYTPIGGAGAASSVAWGDVNNDSLNDILFGSPINRNASRLYFSSNGQFGLGSVTDFFASGLGAQVALIGDVGGGALGSPSGGQMDVLLDTLSGLRVSFDRAPATNLALPASLTAGTQSAALGDADGDGDLDLALAASGGALMILRNNGSGLAAATQIAVPNAPANITSLAWGDFNGDHYLDLAVGAAGGQSSLLINNSDLTFTRSTLASLYTDKIAGCTSGSGRAAAWADVDGDGRLDLTMAFNLSTNSGEVCVLRNTGAGFARLLRFNEDAVSLDWGDWDNDKDLDLAMARSNAGARVYANIGGAFFPIWEGAASVRAAAVRFGDKDGDGDLDLALARTGSGDSGYYENRSVTPVHLLSTAEAALLPVHNSYVQVQRPGVSRSAYLYSSSEILSGPNAPTVKVSYRLFNPEGQDGDPPKAYSLIFAYSLDGGDNWLPATPAAGQSTTISATLTRTGKDFTFLWNAMADKAIGENASFRVEVVNENGGPAVQKAAGAAASPPFQVRATSCIWPKDPRIFVNRQPVLTTGAYGLTAGQPYADLTFDSALVQGSGVMSFIWQFDDGTPARIGQRITKRLNNGTYSFTLTAVGSACPETRSALAKATISVGTGKGDYYLPLVTVSSAGSAAEVAAAAGLPEAQSQVFLPMVETTPQPAGAAATDPSAQPGPDAAPQGPAVALLPALAGLDGAEQNGRVTLTWQPPPPGGATEVRIWRWPLDDPDERTLETTLPPMTSRYTAALGCGMAYAVVPANAGGEADMGAIYLLQPCDQEVK